VTGFIPGELPIKVEGFEEGYKAMSGFSRGGGKRAVGNLRIRWFNAVGGCVGGRVEWSSTAT
jgi:hypothetical protein